MKRVPKKSGGWGRTLSAMLLFACGLLLAEQIWMRFMGGVEVRALDDMNALWETQLPVETAAPDRPSAEDEPERIYPGVALRPETGFLSVYKQGETEERIVALTIDDCYQKENLSEIVKMISEAGGAATLFPIGENVRYLKEVLKEADALGFEIENHTQSHAGLYEEDDEELAYQIWQQNREVSKALGVDYQMHFLRPRGGDNRYDQRTHAYMRQMGYFGIAYWSQVGSENTAEALMDNLQPGDVILFHTTDQDVETIRNLIPMLQAAGYRMVTMNEMFELPPNEQGELADEQAPMPLEEYKRFNQTLRKGDYLHDVLLMQQRLDELDFLSGSYNGYFGEQTEKALKAFQKKHKLQADGVCGRGTWKALFGEEE